VSYGVDAAIPVTYVAGPGDDLIETGDGADTLDGGPGHDRLRSGGGADVLVGGEGNDELDGYEGADRLDGGEGDDLLHPDHYERASADVVDGGPGVDRIESDWSTRLLDDPEPPVAITLGGGADDGRPGEGDDIRGVERLILSKGGRVVGTDAAEYVKLHQVGDAGELVGAGGDDELRGGDGRDTIDGGPGADLLDGGFGDDAITGGPGRDTISADLAGGDCGPLWCKYPFGNDTVDARDGEVDSISCGAGTDRCWPTRPTRSRRTASRSSAPHGRAGPAAPQSRRALCR
jgi:Ca2+-binding RTX toxin-like protein